MAQTLLITGTGGFIGKNLKEFLKNDFKILSPRSFELDCTDADAVSEYFSNNDIDFVIHCGTVGGARGVKDKDTTVEENLRMVENILRFKKQNCEVILFGSGAMYDKSRSLHKVKEDEIGDIIPNDLYGKSKYLISELVKNRKDTICLNIFACYGHGEKESRFPTYAITQNLKHLPIEINQDVVFDYLYIDDLCKIVKHFIFNKPKANIINVTPVKSIMLSDIAEIINKISNFKSEIIIKNKEIGNEYTGDNSRLSSEMPDLSFTPYEEGLAKFYKYLSSDFGN